MKISQKSMIVGKKLPFWPLILVFLIFSMLLNCMGIIILQFSEEKITYQGLGYLESFKDVPIALASLLFINFINRFGSKLSLLISLGFVAVCCILVPFLGQFWFMKIWFAMIGVGFAVAKISTFSLIKSNFGPKQLVVVMNKLEAAFMFGIFAVNIGFGWLIASRFSEFWKFGFWFIAFVTFINIFLLINTRYSDIKEESNLDIIKGFIGIFDKRTFLFLIIMFLIVFTEQCLNSWLPTFYKNYFKVSPGFALQSSAFLALFSFVGRSVTSRIINRFSWFRYILFCFFMLVVMMISMFVFINYFQSVSMFLIYLIPCIGLFLSPLYPVFNSRMLVNYDEKKVNMLISALVIFSSLGSSFGSIYISWSFQTGNTPLYPLFILIPILILIFLTFNFRKINLSK